MKHFVTLAGNIGAGKTSLTAALARQWGWDALFEPVVENPYLADFYQDMRRWGFHSQTFFLSRRLNDYRGLLERPGSVIQDRSVYEDAEIFAYNLHRQGYINERDWQTYYGLYSAVASLLPPPSLVVYLRASAPALLQRIHRRGRDIERSISPDYLEQLNTLYEEWISRFDACPTLIIDTDDVDFAHDETHLTQVAEMIQAALKVGRVEG